MGSVIPLTMVEARIMGSVIPLTMVEARIRVLRSSPPSPEPAAGEDEVTS